MKKALICILLLTSIIFLCGMAETQTDSGSVRKEKEARPMVREEVFLFYSVDDFEDGEYAKTPEWWVFDGINAKCRRNSDYQKGNKIIIAGIGDHSLNLKGKANNWYIGGVGTYLGVDASKYSYLQMDIYGRGKHSGKIRLEIYDDDNGNWQIEHDITKGYAQLYDDKFIYDIDVNWTGWERISIPLIDLIDDNPGIGDDIWNPSQNSNSGGLIQLQVIVIASGKTSSVDINIDNLRLVQAGQVR